MSEKDALNEVDVIFEKLIHIAELLEEEIDVYIQPPDTHSLRKRWEKAKNALETNMHARKPVEKHDAHERRMQ